MNKIISLTLMSAVISGTLPTRASARWSTFDEADAAVNFRNISYTVHSDDTYVYVVEQQTEILKESARGRNGLTRLTFDSHAASFEVLEAKTINPEGVTAVDSDHIEIKPLASSGPGFDQRSMATIGFPDVKVGSKLYLKYRQIQKKANVPGYFSDMRVFLTNEYVQNAHIHYESEVPLYSAVNDPDQWITRTSVAKGGTTVVDFQLKKPVYPSVVEEENSRIAPASLIWFSVSTLKDWSEFPQKTVAAYEKVINSRLPDKFVKIYGEALHYASDFDQINSVISQLQDDVRYLGDWLPIQGAFHPRPLETIARTGYGDCKDFSVSGGAILRRLGYDVHVAWIVRGEHAMISPLTLPAYWFNHAILYLKKDDREYWLDPTNISTYAQGLYPDIADRPALVLDPDRPFVKSTPALLPSQSSLLIDLKLRFTSPSEIEEKGTYSILGHAAVWLAGASLSNSKAHIDYDLIHWLSGGRLLTSWKIGNYDFSSRTVKDVVLPVEATERWLPTLTSAGSGYGIYAHNFGRVFNFVAKQRVSDLLLGNPGLAKRELRFVEKKVVLPKKIECSAQSEWVDFSRRFQRDRGDVVFTEEVTIKKEFIPVNAVHSTAFEALQHSVVECMQEAVVIFQ